MILNFRPQEKTPLKRTRPESAPPEIKVSSQYCTAAYQNDGEHGLRDFPGQAVVHQLPLFPRVFAVA
jgi:hypothetical protein